MALGEGERSFLWGVRRIFVSEHQAAGLWLTVRLYLGYVWFSSGWEKITGHTLELGGSTRLVSGGAWIGSTRGRQAVEQFVDGALARTSCPVPGWYAVFLKDIVRPHAVAFAGLVAWGELFVGAGLLFGTMTGAAAFFGVLMNVCYLLAGARGSNPKLAILGSLVLWARRPAGYYGLDRFTLPASQYTRGKHH